MQNAILKFRQSRGGSRTAATSKVELFVIRVNGFQPLTIITKSSTVNVAAVLDSLLTKVYYFRETRLFVRQTENYGKLQLR